MSKTGQDLDPVIKRFKIIHHQKYNLISWIRIWGILSKKRKEMSWLGTLRYLVNIQNMINNVNQIVQRTQARIIQDYYRITSIKDNQQQWFQHLEAIQTQNILLSKIWLKKIKCMNRKMEIIVIRVTIPFKRWIQTLLKMTFKQVIRKETITQLIVRKQIWNVAHTLQLTELNTTIHN